MYQHSPQTLAGRRLDHQMLPSSSSRVSTALHGRSRCRRSTRACTFGTSSERTVNVRTGALSLEADAPVVAAAAAAAAAADGPHSSGISRRRIRHVGGGSSSSSNSSSNGSSSSILSRLSLSSHSEEVATPSLDADLASADVSSHTPAAAAAAAAAAPAGNVPLNGSSSSSSSSTSTAAAAAAAAVSQHAATNGAGAAAAAPAMVPADADSSDAGSIPAEDENEDEEAAKQLKEELQQASCSQDVLDIIADEVAHFESYHTVTALARLAKMSKEMTKPQRLAMLLDPGFMQLLGRLCVQGSAGILTPFQLSNALYSCGVLQAPIEHLKTRSTDGTTGPAVLEALEAAITSRVTAFNDRDVSSALYGYAQLRLRRQQSWPAMAALVSRAQSLLAQGACSPRCTSMTLWALATLFGSSSSSSRGGGGSSSHSVPAHAFAAAAAHQMASDAVDFMELGSQGVANSVWGCVKLGVKREEALMAKALDWLAANSSAAKMQEVLNILWAAGACRYRPPQLASIVTHVVQHAESLKPADIASLFHVLGIFGFDFSTRQEQLQQLLARASALLPNMKPFEVTSLFWGLGMIREVDNTLFRDITVAVMRLQQQQAQAQAQLAELQQQQQQQQDPQQQQQQQQMAALQARARQLPDSLQRQAFQAYIAARLEDVAVELPADVLDALRQAWLAGSRNSSSSSSSRGRAGPDPLLAEFAWFLREFDVGGKVGVRSQVDGLVPVDVQLMASGQRCVALQLLPDAELDNNGSKLATVRWEEDVLYRNKYDVVHWLSVSDYTRIPPAAKPRYVAELLRKFGVNPVERKMAAAEKAWIAAGCKPGSSGGRGSGSRGGDGSSWGGRRGAGDISAAEADVLMQDGGSSSAGGWASGGRGTRSKRTYTKRR